MDLFLTCPYEGLTAADRESVFSYTSTHARMLLWLHTFIPSFRLRGSVPGERIRTNAEAHEGQALLDLLRPDPVSDDCFSVR